MNFYTDGKRLISILFVLAVLHVTDSSVIFHRNYIQGSTPKRNRRHSPLNSSQLCKAFGCVNGECVASEMKNFRIVCSCYAGYEGKLCDRLICPYSCGQHGTCMKEEEMLYCQCDHGYYGVTCNSTTQVNLRDSENNDKPSKIKAKVIPLDPFKAIPKFRRPKTKTFTSKTRRRWFSQKFNPHRFHSHAEIDTSVSPEQCAPGFKCYHGRCDREAMSYGIFRCLCQENYSGLFCEKKCTLNCYNDGYCTVLDDGHQYCVCPFDFTGHYCEKRATKRYWDLPNHNTNYTKEYRRNPQTVITKTYLYNIDPLKPHFYIVKLGFTGVYIIFLFLLKNIDCGYSLEPPHRGGSDEYHNLCFEQKYEKYQSFLSENFQFLEVKFSIYLNRRVFVMVIITTLCS